MALNYEVKKRVFGFDETKMEGIYILNYTIFL